MRWTNRGEINRVCAGMAALVLASAAWGQCPGMPSVSTTGSSPCAGVTLNWSSVPLATSYEVYRTTGGAGGTTLGTVIATTFVDPNPPAGQMLMYSVRARGAANPFCTSGFGPYSIPVTFAPLLVPGATVTGLSVSNQTCGGFTVSWTPLPGATSYRVRVVQSGTQAVLSDATQTGSSITVNSSAACTVEVTPSGLCGRQGSVATLEAGPTPDLTNVVVTSVSSTYTCSSGNPNWIVSWPPVEGATSYDVWLYVSGLSARLWTTFTPSISVTSQMGELTVEHPVIRVQAKNACSQAEGQYVPLNRSVVGPGTPGFITMTLAPAGGAVFQWGAADRATRYRVQRNWNSTTPIDTFVTGTSFYDANIPVGVPTEFQVWADDGCEVYAIWHRARYFTSTDQIPTAKVAIHPAPAHRRIGEAATLRAFVEGTDLSFKWYRGNTLLSDGGRVSGSQTQTLTISGLTLADAGLYELRVQQGFSDPLRLQTAIIVENPCPADFNASRNLDVNDVFDYLNAWFGGCP